jgi:hypothetical protein
MARLRPEPFRPAFVALALVLTMPWTTGGRLSAADKEGAAAAEAAPARKILVVAKIQEEVKRRQLEGAAQKELKEKGVETILGSDVMQESDFASVDTIRAKVESLGVDGVLGYVVLGVDETVKTSHVSLGIGVGGYTGGGMSVFVGGSVPLGGGSKVVRKVRLRGRYFARPFQDPAWEKVFTETLTDDTTKLTQQVAYYSVKALKKEKLIPAK